MQKTCCIIGQREISEEKIYFIKERLRKEIIKAIKNGFTHFISSFEDVIDLMFADIVVELMGEYPNISLEAAISHLGKLNITNICFQKMLDKCKVVGITSEKYYEGCFLKRNRLMVNFSQLVISVFDGRNIDETLHSINYAKSLGKEVIEIKI